MEKFLEVLNSPIGITAVAGVILFGLNKLYAKNPKWRKYEGSLIAAVKYAEKAIDDKTENKGLRRLDAALDYAIKVLETTEKKRVSKKVIADLKEGIQLTHHKLEETGSLNK